MKSMTGFGRAERIAQGIPVTVQVSSVNRKNLEVMCSLPKEFQSLERKVVEQAKQAVGRGRLQFSIDVRDTNGGSVGLPSDSQMESAHSGSSGESLDIGIALGKHCLLLNRWVNTSLLFEEGWAPPQE